MRLAAAISGAASITPWVPFARKASYEGDRTKYVTISEKRSQISGRTVLKELDAEFRERLIGMALLFVTIIALMASSVYLAVARNQDVVALCLVMLMNAVWGSVLLFGGKWAKQLRAEQGKSPVV